MPSFRERLAQIPAWQRLFQRKYQLKTVLRMNELLAEQGLTQKELAESAGWSKGYVSRLLSGGGNLTLRTLAKFEAAVGAEVTLITASTTERPVVRDVLWVLNPVRTVDVRPTAYAIAAQTCEECDFHQMARESISAGAKTLDSIAADSLASELPEGITMASNKGYVGTDSA